MKRITTREVFGLILIGAGVLSLLDLLDIAVPALQVIWMLVLAVAGVALLLRFVNDASAWWGAIGGAAALGVAMLLALDLAAPELSAAWSGTLFLGSLGAGFGLLRLRDRRAWWAVIPGGVLLTLAVVARLGTTEFNTASGGVFFLGLALTFGTVYLLPTPAGRQRWAIFPATATCVLAIITLSATTSLFAMVWPAALIVLGLYLIFRRQRPQAAVPTPTPTALPADTEAAPDDQAMPQPH